MYKIRALKKEADKEFFDELDFESFKHDFFRGKDVCEEEARSKFLEFQQADPLDPWGENHMVYFVETTDGTLIGIIWLAKRKPFFEFKEQLVWIYNIHVIPEYRNRGLEEQLLEKAEEWALSQGLKSIGLHVLDFGTQAQDLCQTLGYRLKATHNDSRFYEKKLHERVR